MATLYELSAQFNQVVEMLQEEDFNEAVIDTLEALDLAIEDKADGYARLIKEQETKSKAIGEEIKRLKARKQTAENKASQMKLSLQNAMYEIGKTKFSTDLFNFSIQKNPPKVEILDENLIPEEFFKIKKEVDKTAIKEAGEVEGTQIVRTESLRIR